MVRDLWPAAGLVWREPYSRLPRSTAHTVGPEDIQPVTLCLLFNAGESAAEFLLPSADASGWAYLRQHGNECPGDIFPAGAEPAIPEAGCYRVEPRSLAVLALG
jgi:hypothetical protein